MVEINIPRIVLEYNESNCQMNHRGYQERLVNRTFVMALTSIEEDN